MAKKTKKPKAKDKAVIVKGLNALRTISTDMIARDEVDYILKLAVLTRQHVQAEGPPGTGKTLQAKRFFGQLEGEYFETSLSKFSTEEALFGPINIADLREGKYSYCHQGTLLTAHFGFIDEGFDASDALLRALNTPLNEREFNRGEFSVKIPLITCIMTSNYSRNNEILAALVDRFIFKVPILPLIGGDKEKLMAWEEKPIPKQKVPLSVLTNGYKALKKIPFDSKTMKILIELSDEFGFTARRTRQAKDAIQAHCLLQGEKIAEAHDVVVLKYLISSEPGRYADAYNRITELTVNTAKICVQEEHFNKLEKDMVKASEIKEIKDRLKGMAAVVKEVKRIRPLNDEMKAKKARLLEKFGRAYRYQFQEGIAALGWETPQDFTGDDD